MRAVAKTIVWAPPATSSDAMSRAQNRLLRRIPSSGLISGGL